jgi:RNAse (barnase) inhibitor barstar
VPDVKELIKRLIDSMRARQCDVENATELFRHGEWHVGFEMLAENLYEQDFALSESEIQLSRMIAEFWKNSEFYYVLALQAAELLASSGSPGKDGRYPRRILTLKYCSKNKTDLHRALANALGFPEFYGKNWNAFWDAITGLVAMPHCLVLWDWDVLRASMPEEALQAVSKPF